MAKVSDKGIYSRIAQSNTNTDPVAVIIANQAEWIQVVAIASTPNSGAKLALTGSPSLLVDDMVVLKDQNGVAITLDLNDPTILKLSDVSVDKIVFTPSGLTAGTYKVIVTYIAEAMEKG